MTERLALRAEVKRHLKGHTAAVGTIAWDRSGQMVVTGSLDTTVRLWNPASGQQTAKLVGHTECVYSTVFAHDSQNLLSCSGDKNIRLWDTQANTSSGSIKAHAGAVMSIDVSSDGQQIISCGWDRTARLWSAEQGDLLALFEGHTAPVSAVIFSPDCKSAVTGSHDSTMRVWDTTRYEPIGVIEGHTAAVTSIAFAPNGLVFASASWDKTIRIWNGIDGSAITTLARHEKAVNCVKFAPNGAILASASSDSTIRLWDARNYSSLGVLQPLAGPVLCLTFSANSIGLACGTDSGAVQIWDVLVGDQAIANHQRSEAAAAAAGVTAPRGPMDPAAASIGANAVVQADVGYAMPSQSNQANSSSPQRRGGQGQQGAYSSPSHSPNSNRHVGELEVLVHDIGQRLLACFRHNQIPVPLRDRMWNANNNRMFQHTHQGLDTIPGVARRARDAAVHDALANVTSRSGHDISSPEREEALRLAVRLAREQRDALVSERDELKTQLNQKSEETAMFKHENAMMRDQQQQQQLRAESQGGGGSTSSNVNTDALNQRLQEENKALRHHMAELQRDFDDQQAQLRVMKQHLPSRPVGNVLSPGGGSGEVGALNGGYHRQSSAGLYGSQNFGDRAAAGDLDRSRDTMYGSYAGSDAGGFGKVLDWGWVDNEGQLVGGDGPLPSHLANAGAGRQAFSRVQGGVIPHSSPQIVPPRHGSATPNFRPSSLSGSFERREHEHDAAWEAMWQ